MTETLKNTLSASFESTGKSLASQPAMSAPLRELQYQLSNLQYAEGPPWCRFVAFALSAYIEDFFYNLTGDIPFNAIMREAHDRTLSRTGELLLNLSTAVTADKPAGAYEILEQLICHYVDDMGQLNQKVRSWDEN